MITIAQGDFKAKMNEYFNRVVKTGEEVIVTNKNIPIVKIIPIQKKKRVEDAFADVRGKVKYHDDILKPETEGWELHDSRKYNG